MTAAVDLAADVGVVASCDALSVSRATYYRRQRPAVAEETKAPRKSHRALSDD